MTIEVKKVEDEYRLFVFREMADSNGKKVQVRSVNGQRIEARNVDSQIQMAETDKTRAQEQIDYWTDIKTKLEAEAIKEVIKEA